MRISKVHWFTWWNSYQKPQMYQKLTVSKKSEKADPDARVKMYNKCDLWLQSSESIKSQNSAIESLSQQLIFTFQECWCKADGCLGFISPRSVGFFLWSTPPKKNEVHQSTEGFRLCSWHFWACRRGRPQFRNDDENKHFSRALCSTNKRQTWHHGSAKNSSVTMMWDLKPSIHGECVIPFLP